jgi:SAM-dependent methyltransferase
LQKSDSPRVIELGAGMGDASLLLAKKFGLSITLVDINRTALEKAKQRFAAHNLFAVTFQQDLLEVFPETLVGRFDFSVSFGVAEHFKNEARLEVIRKHFLVLKEGGITIVGVPNRLSWPYRFWKWNLEKQCRWPYGFENPFSIGELRSLAKKAGFMNVVIVGSGFYDTLDKFLLGDRPRLRKILKFILGGQIQQKSLFDTLMGYNLMLIAQKPGK